MANVIVVQPGGGEAIAGGTSVRHVKVDIDNLHVTEYSVVAVSKTETVTRGNGKPGA